MNVSLSKLADFVRARTQWIIDEWTKAVERRADLPSSENVTYRQLVDHLPSVLCDLAERLRNEPASATEARHAKTHARHRWQQGYQLHEIIRESGIIRWIVSGQCLDDFARETPQFDAVTRREAERIIHEFFSDMLTESAQQFAAEKQKALAASEQTSQAILDSALDCIIVMGQDGRVREWNPAAEQLFGHKRSKVIGQELAELIIPPELRLRHRDGLAHYLATGEGPLLGRRIEVPALRADGSRLFVELAIATHRIDDQWGFTAYLRDITARKAGEEARQRLAAIVESSDEAIISKDLNGTITTWNNGAQQLFGYTADEIIGEHITTLIPEQRQSEEPGILEQIRRGERIEHYETIRRRKDGSHFNISITVSPIKDAAGNVIGASKIARDISERVRTDARRNAQYAVANLLSGQAPLIEIGGNILDTIARSGRWVFAALWVLHNDGQLKCHTTWRLDARDLDSFESETRRRIFARAEGLPGRAIVSGKPDWLTDLTKEADFPRAPAALASGLQGAFVFPLLGSNGVNGVIELFTDEKITPDDDLLRLVEALGIQVGLYIQRERTEEELLRQKEAAEKANQAKDRFLAALSHELRTPLNPVLMWACAASHANDITPELKEGLQMVCRNIEMEARLIDDLLDLTRIARGKLKLKLQPSPADTLLEHALEIVRSQLTTKSLHLSVDLQASNHRIMCDPTRMEQVFWNLLKNACKFTEENGEIVVRSYDSAPGTVAFEISDTGTGIDAEVMPKLFTPFEQGADSGEGLGLGLAICRAIVEMHHGTIRAANRPAGRGAVFTVELRTVVDQRIGAPVEKEPATISHRKLHILIVEDHEHTAAVMSKILRHHGHDVMTASTVRGAIEILRAKPLDLLVSDLGLPDGNGFQVMRELSRISDAKGIAISGYGMEEDVERSHRAGFSAHLTKPIDVEKLQEAILQVTA